MLSVNAMHAHPCLRRWPRAVNQPYCKHARQAWTECAHMPQRMCGVDAPKLCSVHPIVCVCVCARACLSAFICLRTCIWSYMHDAFRRGTFSHEHARTHTQLLHDVQARQAALIEQLALQDRKVCTDARRAVQRY